MTLATRLKATWDSQVSGKGNTITIYDPTIAYNDEKDVSSYTLDAGTSITAIVLEDADGTTWSSEVEGIDNRLTVRILLDNDQAVDNESIFKIGDDYYTVAQGSLRETEIDDTVVAKRVMAVKMLPQEVAKIA